MINVTVLRGFDHGGAYRRGDRLSVGEVTARRLRAQGLVSFDDDTHEIPAKAVGAKQSASPAAPALQQTTVKKSNNGGARKRTEASSARIPLFG